MHMCGLRYVLSQLTLFEYDSISVGTQHKDPEIDVTANRVNNTSHTVRDLSLLARPLCIYSVNECTV